VQEFIARGDMAIDSAVPGYKVRTFALPLGMWPKTARSRGAARGPTRRRRPVRYGYDAVLEVSGNPNESPYDPAFNARSVNRPDHVQERARGHAQPARQPGAGGAT
jgi:hypothetical protein